MIHLICGKLCSGKSTFARRLAAEHSAVILSVDEIMLLFPDPGAALYDGISRALRSLLLDKAIQISRSGADVILDWGFWVQEERAHVRERLQAAEVPSTWYYLDIDDATWRQRIAARNASPDGSYPVDEGLLQKFQAKFEPPSPEEITQMIRL